MSTYRCSSCGREIEAAPRCPHCGAEQGQWADDLARIERSIAEIKMRDAAIASEQKQLAAKMQAALFQRDILTHANDERRKQATKPRRVLRRRGNRRPPTAEPGLAPPRVPRQSPTAAASAGTDTGTGTADDRPVAPPPPPPPPPRRSGPAGIRRPGGRPDDPPPPNHKPEASTREVQGILLGLGALLLGVAAVAFAVVAISAQDDFSRVAILLTATALMLVAPPLVARRGLTATAETIAAVGLLLVPLNGYAVWAIDAVWTSGLPGSVFAGLTCLLAAAVGWVYGSATGLHVGRYATLIAGQPVLPLLAYEWINGATGWALVLALVAAIDLALARAFTRDGRLLAPPTPRQPRTPRVAPAPTDGQPSGDGSRRRGTDDVDDGPERPESAPEEADAVLTVPTGRREERPGRINPEPVRPEQPEPVRTRAAWTSAAVPTTPWLRELSWTLHGLAVGGALLYAVIALVGTDSVPGALRAGLVLVLAAAIGLAGALSVGRAPLTAFAAGVLTLAVIGAAGRVAAVALPGRALLLIALVVALTGLGVRVVPEAWRRGPQLASAVALVVIGVVVAGSALRAALAPIQAALPVWRADLGAYASTLTDTVGPASWQLVATAFLLTVAAVLSLPPEVRREFAVTGAALTALAAPASLGLSWAAAPWPPVLAAIGIGVVGLTADTRRAALAHAVAAGVVGLAGAGASAARPSLTAAVLLTLAVAGLLISLAPRIDALPLGESGHLVSAWAAGGAAFALPGAVAAFVAATVPVDPTPTALSVRNATEPVLAASYLAVCATLGYAALAQVSQRNISLPLTLGTGFGALAVTAAAFGAPGAAVPDAWVGALLMVAAVLLFLAPSIDAGRRADRLLDGSDFAAAAATAGLVGALARIAGILAPGAELAVAAGLVVVVAVGVRALPEHWRRGPVLGVVLSGGVIALIAGYTAISGGLRVLATPGRIWAADLDAWPMGSTGASAWQAPIALVLLAAAAAAALPRPWKYDVAGVCVGLATIGTPAALGLPWWSPIVVGGAVATVYGMAAAAAADPRAGLARATVAAVVALHAVGASLVRPWTTAAALGVIALVGLVVALLARTIGHLAPAPEVHRRHDNRLDDDPDYDDPEYDDPDYDGPRLEAAEPVDDIPPHLGQIGGAAAGGALLALPGAFAALAAALGFTAEVVLTSALAASSLGVALLTLARRWVPRYLPYATVGVVGGATITAVASIPTGLPAGVYAAAAALLGVLAELARAATPPPGSGAEPVRRWSVLGGTFRRMPDRPRGRWAISPAVGAMAAAVLPTLVAVATLGPALVAALVEPYQVLYGIWEGPPATLANPTGSAVDGTHVLAALLLTVAAAMAATGFTGGRPARAIPVVLPGAAITVLIAPISLGLGWPNSTMAALAVFTIAMLGLALTPPPPDAERARSLRLARILVFAIGLAAGGAGLAGALATRELTLFTLGAAVAVGGIAAFAGRTQTARILGWLFASVMAQLFVFTAGVFAGLDPVWSAFGVLAVGAALLLLAATLPRLRQPESMREAATVEWTGYAAALIAGALAFDSPPHIAALLAAWGAVLGVAATRPGRRVVARQVLFWAAVACEITAWWLLMGISDVALPEAYTLPFAALALLVGILESRHRPDLSSWVAYGPALVAAFLPTTVIVLASDGDLRQILLLLGGVAVLIFGSWRRQQAPVIIGAVVTVIATLHLLTVFGPWLVLIPVGIVLLVLGGSTERRTQTQERLRGALRGMR
ncbi:SCO7613 C-terminal domain-containing membrane protein [Micromonospora sp. NPDC050397]|uniref:SCO7613 C-terminal domain-containing membrane protein n=1 Tax=Micromonospora sp. NPDC050397 TaxID=3364279 RepID=UPI00384C58B9